jgi:outer membrane receptor for ferrienterochelin and colicin
VDVSYDFNGTLGGPIVREKAWFFGSYRHWRLDQFQIGATNPDGSQAIDDNRIRNAMGKVTYQVNPNVRTFFLFNSNWKDRFHRRDAPYLFVEDRASVLQDQTARNFVFNYNHVLGSSTVVDARVGRMWGTFPSRYQDEVQPTDIAIRDVVRFTRVNAAEQNFENPNHRNQLNGTVSHFADNVLGGSHDFKVGGQFSQERMQFLRDRNGDVLLELRDGVPFQAQLSNTPVRSDQRVTTWAAFDQDSFVLQSRLTLNLGVRFDGIHGRVPAQASPAGTFVSERSFPERDNTPDWPLDVAPRLGVSFDLFGDGRTAIKGYYGRFYNQIGSEIPEAVNPNAFSTANVV